MNELLQEKIAILESLVITLEATVDAQAEQIERMETRIVQLEVLVDELEREVW